MKLATPILFTLVAASAAPLAAQSTPVTVPPPPPAPPVIRAVPPPPPVMVAPPPPVMIAPSAPKNQPPVVLQVELWGGSEKLWAGQLRVAGYNGANYNSSISEAPETCPADKSNLGYYAPNFGRSVRVNIYRRGYSENDAQFSVSASWTRPGTPCVDTGSSTVSFDRTVTLDAGGKAELKGDGGLIVRLARVK